MTYLECLEHFADISIALSAEKDNRRLLKKILDSSCLLANADGGTVYLLRDNFAWIEVFRNASLDIYFDKPSESGHDFKPIPLFKDNGEPNLNNVVTYSIHKNLLVNIEDSYDASQLDFSGTRKYDEMTGYRSKSFLTVPLRNHEHEIVGVLQLINAQDAVGKVIAFDEATARLIEALASQAAISLTREQLIRDMEKLFTSVIQLIADAIDRKSAHTGEHCRRVPVITMMLAEAVHADDNGPFKDFQLTDKDRHEIEVAGWLHDCGKIVTPNHLIDKATKLETVYDRMETVETRYEVLKRDAEIAGLRRQLAAMGIHKTEPHIEAQIQAEWEQLEAERRFLRQCNLGGEAMDEADQQRVRTIADRRWLRGGQPAPFLEENEVNNLTISRGTLTAEERKIVNDHIVATIEMLMSLPFPKHLSRVPEYAGGHHERMDGKGYPRGLTREQMSIPARILGIADIFEALTSADRPYKSAKPLSEVLRIMENMKNSGHIDPDLFDVFVRHNVPLRYAERFLHPDQWEDMPAE